MAGAGYDIGVSGSSSSGASQSGATSFSQGGNYGSTVYGPGSFVAPANASGLNVSTPVIVAIVVAAAIVLFLIFGKNR